jgi:thiol-disulfide isomerase/thioredoxin
MLSALNRFRFTPLAMTGTWALALLLAGCAGESAPVTAEKSKYKAADAAADSGKTLSATEAGDPAETMINPPMTANSGEPATGDDIGATPDLPNKSAAQNGVRPGAKGAANPSTSTATLALPETDNPKELWQFMEELKSRQPRGTSRAEMVEDFQRIQTARLAAAEKILAAETDEQMKLETLQAMQEIYLLYMQVQVPGAAQSLKAFADNMAKRKDPTLSQYGKLLQFQLRFSQMVGQPTTTGEDIMQEVQALLDEYKDASPTAQQNALMLASSITEMLEQNDMRDEAVKVQRMIAAELKKNKDPKIAEQAGLMEARATITEANLSQLATAVLTGDAEASEKLSEAVKKLLQGENPSIVFVSPLQEVGQLMEYSGNIEPAREIFTSLASAYKEHENAKVAEIVNDMTTNALARLDLVGKPFDIEGVTKDGQPFDWAAYRDKVVLVDFWATWCGPCLQEIPNIRENYETFKDQGFEVVGVNLNADIADVEQFAKVQTLPWPSVFSQQQLDGEKFANWSDIPMAKKYGVDAIPFIVLVGRDGNVDSLHVRGPKLGARLGKLLGGDAPKTESSDPPADAATPSAETDEPAEPKAQDQSSTSRANRNMMLSLSSLLLGTLHFEPEAATETPAEANPYLPKSGLSATQLEAWLEKMLDKPKTIQSRPGFSDAVAEGCDRLMNSQPKPSDSALLLAVETKLHILHQAACQGSDEADEKLQATVKQFEKDERAKIAKLITFYQAERKALDGEEAAVEKVPETLAELKEYFEKEKLAARHLRMASATVALINRLEDGDEREKQFEQFGKTFATSSDKELARYGRKLAKKPAVQESDLVGKELLLEGVTTQGLPLAWNTYRGKVVVVDFWATWCGPCKKELPNVIAAYEKHKEQGFEVLGISLDKDMEALTAFLEQNSLPWPTLAGEDTEAIATKYGVRGIPTLMLVDREGKVAAVAHRIEQLQPQIDKLLNIAVEQSGE